MTDTPADGDRRAWHRRFAIDTNNEAWPLVERPALTAEEGERLLVLAAASAYHWGQVGTEQQRALASVLLAIAHARVGSASVASANATAAFVVLDRPASEAWERAFAHAARAAAAAVSGDADAHAAHHRTARDIGDTLDSEDKAIFLATFRQIPEP